MPRKNLIRSDLYYYHVTTRSNHKEWFKLPLEKVWEISLNALHKAYKNSPAKISQYVLMSNHYHLLIKTPNSDIDRFMFWFNKTFSDQLRKESGQINRMFGSSYKWSIIFEQRYLNKVFQYIYQNPLRAGLVNRCEDYPYSTLHYLVRKCPLSFPFEEDIFYDYETTPINRLLSTKELNDVKQGLRKTIFKPNSPRTYKLRTQSQK